MSLAWIVPLAAVVVGAWYVTRPRTDLHGLPARFVGLVFPDGALRWAVVRSALGRATRPPGGDTSRLRLEVPLDVQVHAGDERAVQLHLDSIERTVRRVARQRRIDIGPGFRLERVVVSRVARPGQPWVTAAVPEQAVPTFRLADDRTVGLRPPMRGEQPTAVETRTAHLVLVGEPHVRLAVPPAGGTLGRDRDRCDIAIDRPTVSRLHAELRPAAGGFLVTDRSSANGITIRGTRTTRGRIAAGDVLGLGRSVELTLEFDDA